MGMDTGGMSDDACEGSRHSDRPDPLSCGSGLQPGRIPVSWDAYITRDWSFPDIRPLPLFLVRVRAEARTHM